MKLDLPDALIARLKVGVPQFDDEAKTRLKEILNPECLKGGFLPKLYSIDEICCANELWRTPDRRWYMGHPAPEIEPGTIDPSKTIIFGHIEPDSPLALDLRTKANEVIYFGDIRQRSCWLGLNMSVDEFFKSVFDTKAEGDCRSPTTLTDPKGGPSW